MNLYRVLLHGAGLLAPRQVRAEWLREWQAELWHVQASGIPPARVTAFCCGAFRDALWLRRHSPTLAGEFRSTRPLNSPTACLALLVFLSAMSAALLTRFLATAPFHPDTRNLVVLPAVSPNQYLAFASDPHGPFDSLAYYQPHGTAVITAPRRISQLSLANTTPKFFQLLGIPGPPPSAAGAFRLILTEAAWRRCFLSDAGVVGRTLSIDGHATIVAGVTAFQPWSLPGRVDGWILSPEPFSAPDPLRGNVYVLGLPRPTANLGGFHPVPLSTGLPGPLSGFGFVLFFACMLLPVTTTVTLGEYPANPCSVRRWLFLAAKLALILFIVYCAMRGLVCFARSNEWAGTLVQILLWGCTFAFRWVLSDQRQRCPVCLRLLSHPARVGQSSQTFLGWNGTEFACSRGHGLLHVPETPTSWFSTQRWLYLDASWSHLFSAIPPTKISRL